MTGPKARTSGPSRILVAVPAWLAAGWRGIAGTAATATVALAVMALAAVFVAVAAPRLDLDMRTGSLQQVISAVPAAGKSVVATAGWSQLARPASRAGLLSASEMDTETIALATGMSAARVPLAPPSADWSGLTSGYVAVSGTARAANAGGPPRLEIAYRSSLPQHSRLVAGHEPDRSSVRLKPGISPGTPAENLVRAATFEVAVTQATAARFGLRAGSRLTAGHGITLLVAGLIRPSVPGSAFWTLDPVASRPALTYPGTSAPYWAGAAFIGPAEAGNAQRVFGSPDMQLVWDFPLSLGHVDADTAGQLAAHLAAAVNQATAGGNVVGPAEPAPGIIRASCGLASHLAAFLQAQAAVEAILSLLLICLVVVGGVTVVLGGYLLAGHRAGEFAVMRARGATSWQVGVAGLGGVVPAAAAVAAGVALAVAVTPGYDAPQAWWLGGGTALAALASLPLLAAGRHRAADRAARRSPEAGSARWVAARRPVMEVTLAAAAVGGLVLLHQQGLPHSGGLNVYIGAAPVLVAVLAVLVAMRLYPLALRGLLRLSAARRGITGFVAMARAARASPAAALPAFALALALGVLAFGGMVQGAVQRGQVAASWQVTGADAVIDDSASPAGVSQGAQRAIGAVPGVQHTAAVAAVPGSLPSGIGIEVIAVSPASYAALTASTPWPRFPAAALATRAGTAASSGQTPAVAATAVAADLRAGPVQLPLGTASALRLRVTAVVSATPALPGQDMFVVVPSSALSQVPPSLLLVTGAHINRAALTAAVHRRLPHAVIRFRSAALAALAGSPLQRGAYTCFGFGIAAAAGFCVVIVLLGLAVEARSRKLVLGRLAAMGLGAGQARRMAVLEGLPVTLAAACAGAVCGWALAPLTGPALDLSVFTGNDASVPIRASATALAVPAAGLVVLVLLVLTVHTIAAHRRGPGRALRAYDRASER
jgi:putative ABC transport system permease protein